MKKAGKWLVIESGSTKSDWVLFNEKERFSFQSSGMNPVTMSADFIEANLKDVVTHHLDLSQIEELYFYGAGCKNSGGKLRMQEIMASTLPPSILIEINSDILACARACSEQKNGIVAILGTGSHAALCDGHQILHDFPSLGFILGDEGSGGYFGKRILPLFILDQLDRDLTELFKMEYPLTKDQIISDIYTSQSPSKKLGLYGKFVVDHKEHPQMKSILLDGMSSFINQRIKIYHDKKHWPVHACGSVAYLLQVEFSQLLEKEGFQTGTIIKSPINNLVDYHLNRKRNS